MTIETLVAIALAALAMWLLIRHVRKLLRGEAGGCGCCKGTCRPHASTPDACPGAMNPPEDETSQNAPSEHRSDNESDGP